MAARTARTALPTSSGRTARAGRLTREHVVASAIELADAEGLDAVSMRRLGQVLGVDPMAIYRHVDGKEALLDAMTDTVVAQIQSVTDAGGWQASARATMLAARAAMLRHPWTAAVRRTRTEPTPAELRHLDTLLGILRNGGLSVDLTHHAIHALGSRVLGFSQDLYDDGGAATPEQSAATAAALARTHPRLAELAVAVTHDGALGACDDDLEFAFAVDLVLDGLERRRAAEADAT
ncbi:TetR/AcrR family transcriptional regulator C-terminal domain-containing protein [Isoptericola sp. 4D.3]|uniref:TetR/AcrR family transcriptional regulator C-terminal domain-containing protein n=1 Tax=Isoptericola peretonis TaxID=2918523 RepID=A0ABT0J851_9MICO|nr:TetR/AcrR family transcriptional regulator C-terminal domain-containing protein [Isoptericola sp. 4D.3]